ncbi:MAG: DUF3108 domain-containing protein [Candidatus Omnitrophica bacterium]|nr:DUF3108 domain-containing protein [Candidatus Omnitrophota bacterium]
MRALVFVGVWLLATGPAQAGTLPVGETLHYQARWLGFVVGEGSLSVQELTMAEGRSAYHLVAIARSNAFLSHFYPLRDEVHSYVDAERLVTLRYEKKQREGRYRSDEVVTFDYAQGLATYQSLLNGSVKTIPVGRGGVLDPLASLYVLRWRPLPPGESLTLAVYSDEKVYQMEVKVLRRFSLELLRRGVFDCIEVEPLATFKGLLVKRGRARIELTDDARRLPLEVKLGTPWGAITGVITRESLRAALGATPVAP